MKKTTIIEFSRYFKNKFLNPNNNQNVIHSYESKSKKSKEIMDLKENNKINNNFTREIIRPNKRKQKNTFDKNTTINKEIYINLMISININIMLSIFILNFVPISHTKIMFRKFNSFNNEINMLIYGSSNLRILYNKNKNTPTQLYINGIESPVNNSIGSSTSQYYNITMKWNYLLSDCSYMFYGLREIIEIDLTNFDFSNVLTMSKMFYGASSITKIDLSNSNTSLVNDISYLFYNCTKLNSLNLFNFNTSSVIYMQYMFYECHNLEALNIESFNTENVINMEYMFAGCKKITNLSVSHFNTSKVTYFYYMFKDCILLNSINLSNWELSIIYDMDYMFDNCTSLLSVDLSNLKFTNIYDIDYLNDYFHYKINSMNYMFNNCTSLLSANLSNWNENYIDYLYYLENYPFYDIYYGKIYMFNNCTSLLSVDLSNWNIINIYDINNLNDHYFDNIYYDMGYMFNNCTSLLSIDLSNWNISNGYDIYVNDKYFYFFRIYMIFMFNNCTSLLSADLSNWNLTNRYYMDYMFNNCTSLLSVDLSNWNALEVYGLYGMFNNCISLLSVDLSNWNVKYIYSMDYMFNNCTSLLSANLSNLNVLNAENTNWMFNNCTSLISIDLCNINTTYLRNIDYMFNNCTSLKSVNFYNLNVTYIDGINYIFNNCTSLLSADFSNWNATYIYNINHIFNNCTSLLSVNFLKWNIPIVSKMYYIFNNCTSLLSVNLSYWNISYINESNYMFSNIYNNFTYCINDKETIEPNIGNLFTLSNAKRDCSSKCYLTPRRLNPQTNKCDLTNCGQEDNKIFEYRNSCYETCPKKTRVSIEDEYICEYFSCDRFYNFEQKGCLLEIPMGFYLENETSKTINKCHSNCSTCSKESMEYNLCETCNIEEEYFSKINNTLNILPFIYCGREGFEGYYLDNNDNIYKPCYSSCETCNETGNEISHNCLACKPGYYAINDSSLYNKNCYKNCPFYYYFDTENIYQCTLNEECPIEYNMLVKNKSKCIDNCTKDDTHKFEFSSHCFEKCPENTTISEENPYKCEIIISDEITYNTKIMDYLNITIDENEPDEIVNNFKENLLNGGMNDTLLNLINGNQKSVIFESERMSFELTTTKNQRVGEKNNRTSIDLRECENKLKEHYIIDKNLSLIILKIDVSNQGFLIPKIEYEVYDPISFKILNLSVCENTKIDLAIPVNIEESELFRYDIKSFFYNDICYPYRKYDFVDNNKTLCEENCEYKGYEINITKVLCSCRPKIKLPLISEVSFDKEQLYKNFMNLSNLLNLKIMKCHKVLFNKEGIKRNIGCLFLIPIIFIHITSIIIFYTKGFDVIKKKINKIIDIKFNKNNINLSKNENNIKNKIYKKEENNKKDNKKQNKIFKNENKEKYKDKNKEKKEGKKCNTIIVKNNTKKDNKEKREKFKNNENKNSTAIKNGNKKETNKLKTENNNKDKKINIPQKEIRHKNIQLGSFTVNSLINKKKSRYTQLNNSAPPIKNKNKEKFSQNAKLISVLKTNGEILNSTSIRKVNKSLSLNINNTEELYANKKNNEEHNITSNKPNNNLKNRLIDLTDYELNLLEYKDALCIDNRTYSKYYISLIKTRHMIIFTFFSRNDYNSQIIKISFFFFSIALYFTINALFFNETTIHRIKEDRGSFNIEYQIPKIVYSSLISLVISPFVKAICLTEKNIIQLKNLKTKKEIKIESISVLNIIIKKLICYFILTFILLTFFWYYLACFCAVYKKNQLDLFKNTSISYGLSMLYPFLLYLIPGILRIPALRTQKRDRIIMYKFSKILQII